MSVNNSTEESLNIMLDKTGPTGSSLGDGLFLDLCAVDLDLFAL